MRLAAIVLFLCITLPCHASAGGDWNFRVTLDGREIGSHRYTLEPSGQGAVLRSQADFDVRFLFVTAYRYDHEAVERWQNGCLSALDSSTDSNGEVVAVNAVAGEGRTGEFALAAACVLFAWSLWRRDRIGYFSALAISGFSLLAYAVHLSFGQANLPGLMRLVTAASTAAGIW